MQHPTRRANLQAGRAAFEIGRGAAGSAGLPPGHRAKDAVRTQADAAPCPLGGVFGAAHVLGEDTIIDRQDGGNGFYEIM